MNTSGASALDVFQALHAHTRAVGLPPPAALIGDWLDVDAVIAPSLRLVPGVAPPDHPDRFWFGHIGFPVRAAEGLLPQVVGGFSEGVLMLRDGQWHRVGTPPPLWVEACLDRAHAPAAREWAGGYDPAWAGGYDPAWAGGYDAAWAGEYDAAWVGGQNRWSASWTPPAREPHLSAIENCLAAIRAGEVYQACVCTRFTGTLQGRPDAYFTDLTATTVPAKAAFLQGDWGTVASFSPETFLSRRGSVVTSSPIKGTVSADTDPTELASSEKDIAENVMIVDLVRNDLGRVAEVGGVDVPELLTVLPAPGVWHLVSQVRAQLGSDADGSQVGNDALLAATFPPASVTGTPKLRAQELLGDWEADARGVYCGAIGVAVPGGDLDLNVAIRTVQITPDGRTTLGVGGGITIDSDPHREWQECLDKAASIIGATGP